MLELLKNLLANQQLIPLNNCYLCPLDLVYLHFIEFIIAIANYLIPLTLIYFLRLRQDLRFNWIFLLLATVIIICGVADLLYIWKLWYPTYWLSIFIKSIAALGVLYTAFELFRIVPKIVALSSPKQLATTNNITNHQISEADLKASEARFQEIAHTISQLFLVRSATTEEFIYVSPAYERIWGRSCESLYQNPQSWVEAIHPEDRPLVTQSLSKQFAGNSVMREYRIVRPNGEIRWIFAQITIVRDESGKPLRFIGFADDISDRKFAEQALQENQEQIKASLKEKEVLLQEIHHRVKNNLGIVSSLLQMQCRRTQDLQANAILRDSQNRIASIALVHEKLYRSADLSNINFAEYIANLTTHLFDSYNINPNFVKLNIQVDEVSLNLETVIPCGLIINELVSNALKYAFPKSQAGEIQIICYQEDSTLILTIRDNGVGLPQDFDSQKDKTLGLTLVYGLVKQLRGTIEITSQPGVEFKIKLINIKA
ncbi:sensor histidine kinase [Calothrix sp. NIES-2098]|uniref:sensor histidine kinase n=1 Tax=Calothrix sp. NIES-2098 TaxID=1954171 RepID=UPI000B5EFA10|nr:signal transduction histidine kinase [Calothrix sp. NIES-2098]